MVHGWRKNFPNQLGTTSICAPSLGQQSNHPLSMLIFRMYLHDSHTCLPCQNHQCTVWAGAQPKESELDQLLFGSNPLHVGLLKSDCPYPDDENELYEAKVLILSLEAATKPVEDHEIQEEDKTGTTLANTYTQISIICSLKSISAWVWNGDGWGWEQWRWWSSFIIVSKFSESNDLTSCLLVYRVQALILCDFKL